MPHRLMLVCTVVVAGCSFNPGAAQQALMEANVRAFQKDYVTAIDFYNQALANDPTLATAVFYRGIAYRGSGDFDQALADIDRAIEMGVVGSRVYAERARTKLEKLAAEAAGDRAKLAEAFAPNDPLKVVADLNQAVALNSLNLDGPALLLHAAVCIMGGRDADAEIDFERFLRHRPQARAELIDAAAKWKKERPVLDLSPIDDLGRIGTRGGRRSD